MHSPTAMQSEGPAGASTPLVMIIDDDAEMRRVLRDFLTREGFEVRDHGAGAPVFEELELTQPAAIVVDKEMPGIDGLDLLEYIGRRHPTIPVIVITAFGGTAVRAEALRRGAVQYVEKPFRVAQLVDTLRLITERRPEMARGETA